VRKNVVVAADAIETLSPLANPALAAGTIDPTTWTRFKTRATVNAGAGESEDSTVKVSVSVFTPWLPAYHNLLSLVRHV
jgi:hypothetical protein